MDIGMGLFYTGIGLWLVIFKAFGNFPLPPFLAWLLGGMMLVGGVLRFIKGIKAVLPEKKSAV